MKNKIILILTLILVIGCVFAIPAFASTDSSDANVSTDTPPVVGGDEQNPTEEHKMTFKFDIGALVRSEEGKLAPLAMMGLGMVGIFIVTLVIIAVVYALNKINLEAKKDENN